MKKNSQQLSTILVVDDERDIVDLVSYNLEKEGYLVLQAFDGEEAIRLAKTKKPDLVILDLMLPGIQGMEVARILRKNGTTALTPIIMLTAKTDEIDRVLGLEVGADDYISKPFSVRELLARIRAVLRRCESRVEEKDQEIFVYENLAINYRSYSASIDEKKVDLSPKEFKLLKFLSLHPGRVYTRNQLLDHIWGDETFVEPRTIDVHVRRLRTQIEKDPMNPKYIITVRGVGYKFGSKD
ncbi:MAG: response regulator transcription factor [Deltaproteobacteria bacterium]|nr:response regulator transcription factor [Deltaproteobacteria bacterium]